MPQKKKQQKDVISRLADAGEDAIQRLSELPGSARFVEAAHILRERLEELTAKVRSLDPLERRVTELERRLDELSGSAPAPAKRRRARPAARKATSTRARKSST